MKRLAGVLVAAALLGLLAGPEAWAGWVIEQVVRVKAGAPGAAGDGDRQVLTLSNNRLKTVVMDRAGKPVAASIIDLDAQTLTSVNYEQKSITTGTIQEYAESLQGASAAMGGQMAEAMKQMQEAMKDMPPAQRQQMEQMLRKSMPSAQAPSAGACRQPQVEVRPTGQRATIAGFPATRFDVFEDGKFVHELWVSPTITAWRELDPQKMERFSQAMLKATASLPGCGRGRGQVLGSNANDPAWKLAAEGYPVRTVEHATGEGTTLEVVKAESRSVPPTEFQPPGGFARQTFKEMLGGAK